MDYESLVCVFVVMRNSEILLLPPVIILGTANVGAIGLKEMHPNSLFCEPITFGFMERKLAMDTKAESSQTYLVNGQDLRNATHEQAIRAFREAKEPIIVEVARREPLGVAANNSPDNRNNEVTECVNIPTNKSSHGSTFPQAQSIGVQTDVSAEEATLAAMAAAAFTTEDIRAALSLQNNVIPSSETVYSSSASGLLDIVELDAEEDDDDEDEEEVCDPEGLPPPCNSEFFSSSYPITEYDRQSCPCHEAVNQKYDRNEQTRSADQLHPLRYSTEVDSKQYGDLNLSQQNQRNSSSESVVFMEVKLCRQSPNEKFGLTLCYRHGDTQQESCDVYVGEIESDSVASRGRDVRVGDRIVKINGHLIKSRKHVIDLFNDSERTATLLIARETSRANSESKKPGEEQKDAVSTESLQKPERTNMTTSESGHKGCTAFTMFKRPDQDSGLGRTTDESARTEESSEQEIEAEHRDMYSTPDSKMVNSKSLNSDMVQYLSAAHPYMSTSLPFADVFANYDPVDPIDEELVHLGRLMQSLAVHCRQLVQVKMNYRAEQLKQTCPTEHDEPGSQPRQSFRNYVTSRIPNSEHMESTDANSVSSTDQTKSTVTHSTVQASSMGRFCGEGVTPRVPRMGTRLEFSSNGAIHTNSGDTKLTMNSQTECTNASVGAENEEDEGKIFTVTNKMRGLKTSSESVSAYETQRGLTEESYAADQLRQGQQQMRSGQTSAYCTGESLRSQNENIGIGMRIWNPTGNEMVKNHIHPSVVCTNGMTDRLGEWNGEIAASLSDLGGSLLSLAATVPSVNNFYPVTNDLLLSSHLLAESISPTSNWSIDGGSSHSTNQRCPTNLPNHPLLRSGRPTDSSRNHSTDSSRDRLPPIGPANSMTDEIRCSPLDRRPLRSNISSAESLSVTESNLSRIPPCTISGSQTSEGTQKSGSEVEPTTSYRGKSESGEKRAMLESLSKQFNQSAQRNSPPSVLSKQKTERETGSTGLKTTRLPTSEFPSANTSTGMIGTRVNPSTGHNKSAASAQRFASSANSVSPVPTHQCTCQPFFSPQLPHNSHPVSTTRLSTASPTVRTACSRPPGYNLPFMESLLHPYEFYDRFGSLAWAVDATRLSSVHARPVIQSKVLHKPPVGPNASQHENITKVEDTASSDIYETPYASVTVVEEPTTQPAISTESPWPGENISLQHPLPTDLPNSEVPSVPRSPPNMSQQDYSFMQQAAHKSNSKHNPGGRSCRNADSRDLSACTSLFSPFGSFDLNGPQAAAAVAMNSGQYSHLPLYSCASNPRPLGAPAQGDGYPFPGPHVPYLTENLNVMEWVVKKRPDGTRYITRRPIRNRLLKERARRVAEERSGLTTDDDGASELKMGKYWNRTERRKQLERSRADRKKRQISVTAISANQRFQKGTGQSGHLMKEVTRDKIHDSGEVELVTMTTV